MMDKFDYKIYPPRLRLTYLRHGIQYGKAKQVYQSKHTDLDDRRHKYALLLGEIIMKGKKIVYLDETTFNTWLRKTHSWAYENNQQ